MEKEVGNDHADKLAFPVSQYLCQFVFLIIQIDKRLGDDLLILDRQGVGVIKIPGNRGLGKIRIFRDIIKCHLFFAHRAVTSIYFLIISLAEFREKINHKITGYVTDNFFCFSAKKY